MLKRFALLVSAAGMVMTVACAQSDSGITAAVKSKLAADDPVGAYQIDVDTADRVVTLTGTVETSAAKEHALMIARQTEGVLDVADRITVDPEAAVSTADVKEEVNKVGREIREEARAATAEATEAARELGRDTQTWVGDTVNRTGGVVTDATVTSTVKTRFLADTEVSGLWIDVDTKDGVVTLWGAANSGLRVV